MEGRDITALRIGTGSGTLLGLLPQLDAGDLLKTVVLAALGAVVSFAVTLLLQRFVRKK